MDDMRRRSAENDRLPRPSIPIGPSNGSDFGGAEFKPPLRTLGDLDQLPDLAHLHRKNMLPDRVPLAQVLLRPSAVQLDPPETNVPTYEDFAGILGDRALASGSFSDVSVSASEKDLNITIPEAAAPKVRFMCSFGGKILPRPGDGKLRYVGGETRIVSVSRRIRFAGLGRKLMDLYDQPVVLKYQLPGEDLDALVSVSSDEDLENMMEEYDRLNTTGGGGSSSSSSSSSRLRVFLFVAGDSEASSLAEVGETKDPKDLSQRYVDAINEVLDVTARKISDLASRGSSQNLAGFEVLDAQSPSGLHEAAPVSSGSTRFDVVTSWVPSMPIPSIAHHPQLSSQTKQNGSSSDANLGGYFGSNSSSGASQHDLQYPSYPADFARVLESSPPKEKQFPLSQGRTYVTEGVVPQVALHPRMPQVDHFLPDSLLPHLDLEEKPDTSNWHHHLEDHFGSSMMGGGGGAEFAHLPSSEINLQYQKADFSDHLDLESGLSELLPSNNTGSLELRALPKPSAPLQSVEPVTIKNTQPFEDQSTKQPSVPDNSVHKRYETQIDALSSSTGNPFCDVGDFDVGIIEGRHESFHQQSKKPSAEEHTVGTVLPLLNRVGSEDWNYQGEHEANESEFLTANWLTLSQADLKENQAFAKHAAESQTLYSLQDSYLFPSSDSRMKTQLDSGIRPPSSILQPPPGSPKTYSMAGKNANVEAVPLSPFDEPYLGNSSILNPGMVWPTETNPKEETTQLISFEHAGSSDSGLSSEVKWNSKLSLDDLLGLNINTHVKTQPPPAAAGMAANAELNNSFGSGSKKMEEVVVGGDGRHALPKQENATMEGNSSAEFISINPTPREVLAMKGAADIDLLLSTEMPDLKSGGATALSAGNFSSLNAMPSTKSLERATKAGEEEDGGGMESMLDSMNAENDRDILYKYMYTSEMNEGKPIFPVFDSILTREEQEMHGLNKARIPIRPERGNVASEAFKASLYSSPNPSIQNWEQVLMHSEGEQELVTENSNDEVSDEFKADIESEKEGNSDDLKGDNDMAAKAEEEAISRGLQIIKNADLEELRELGSGTFGTVYHGKWRGTDVAIKRIKSSCFTGRPSERQRLMADFWREAIILAQLHHPNVVAFYGVVPDGPDGTLATVTEYMVNGSLKQVLQRKDRSIDRRKRLLIAMDAAFGMEYLHGKRIVHFDLKCENLLVNMRDPQRPICKVGDLGLSKIKQQTMVSGGVRGTLPWMAPELLNGSSSLVSEKVDVYSFGIGMWELLTGEEPYATMHYGAIIGGIVNNTLRPPIPNSCDPAWRSLMVRCWSADTMERPSFSEIARELRSMAASLHPKGQVQA